MINFVTIFERDPVIAADIGDTLGELWPQATLSVVTSIAAACKSILERAGDGSLAILHGYESELRDPALSQALAIGRPRVLAIHNPIDEADFREWVFLTPPFTAPTLQAALRSSLRLP